MQHTHLGSRTLSILLTIAMLFSLLVPAVSAEPRTAAAAEPQQEQKTSELDPASLHVSKLGELDEEPAQTIEQEPYGRNDLVRVSIKLDGPTTLDRYAAKYLATKAATSYRASLLAKQDTVRSKIESATGKSLDVKWNLTLAMNVISANVRYGDIEAIKAVPGVVDVILENRYEAPTDAGSGDTAEPNTANSSEHMVGAVQSWLEGYTGAGMRIAIIDTGLDLEHQSVDPNAFDYSLARNAEEKNMPLQDYLNSLDLFTAEDVSSFTSRTGFHGTGAAYSSTKVPFIYNYVDHNTRVNHTEDTMSEHGSHVAGISAANRYVKKDGQFVDAATYVHAVGMAPDAQLFVMKVFGSGGGAYDSDYMAAIEDAIVMDCDVVNLSLGSSVPGFTTSKEYQDVMNKLADGTVNPKMVASISAGNSYAFPSLMDDLYGNTYGGRDLYIDDVYMHTGGSPGSFTNSLCVAAAENTGVTGSPMTYTYNGESRYVFYTETASNGAAMSSIPGTYELVYIDAMGKEADYQAVNEAYPLAGKVVMVNRGETSFFEKGNFATAYDPAAIMIANNQAGTISMSLDGYTGTVPFVSITLSDANYIKEHSTVGHAGDYTYYTGTISVSDQIIHELDKDNAEITDFSSWGVPGSLIMKPEITAPGGDIYSIWGRNKDASSGEILGGVDQYELMSGTSMAAPHITGLVGVLAQYIDNKSVAVTGHTTRQLVQSLMMSTAVPMHIGSADGPYYPTIQQGAGLANVYYCVKALSAIFMCEDATASYADGKVKAELGDKPSKSGEYSYSFEIHNMSDQDLTYALRTDLFSQESYVDDDTDYRHMGYATEPLEPYGFTTTYSTEAHDVNLDGVTDELDADAILSYLADLTPAADLDLTVADLNNDGAVASRDAYILLELLAETNQVLVPAHSFKTVSVVIHIPADTAALDEAYPSGCYLEGFTYVTCTNVTGEGEILDVEHSIPILGFYGSWTDPNMFDTMSYVDELYGETRVPYSGVSDTNYMTVTYNGVNTKFSGNPYKVESEFPADRLAINTSSTIGTFAYNLVRSAGTLGFALTKLDEDHQVTDVLYAVKTGELIDGMWFNQSSLAWQGIATKFYTANKNLSDYPIQEGDIIRAGFYAIPEYNAMQLKQDTTSVDCGVLDTTGFRTLLGQNVLGDGAFVGYDFTVDNTDPVITGAVYDPDAMTLTVSASDNLNLAYVAVLSLDGETKYIEQTPGTPTAEIILDASDAHENAQGYVAVFVGDYAGNEKAVFVQVNDNITETKTIYEFTQTLTVGKKYVICSRRDTGIGYVLDYTSGLTNTVTATETPVHSEIPGMINKRYINASDVSENAVWELGGTYPDAITFKNGNNYLKKLSNSVEVNIGAVNRNWVWNGDYNYLTNEGKYLYYNAADNAYEITDTATPVYLYEEKVVAAGLQPDLPDSIKLTPESLDLYQGNTVDMVAKVLPLTADDRTVTWSTSDPAVATVDAVTGKVTAVGAGSATITATANANAAVKADCPVTVTVVNKELNGIVWDENGKVLFSSFNTNNLYSDGRRYTPLHETSQGLPLTMAFMESRDTALSDGTLYAGTFNSSSYTTQFYSVDRGNNYELTYYGEGAIFAFDIAKGSTWVDAIYQCDVVFSAMYYLLAGNWGLIDYDEDGVAESAAMPLVMLDMSEYTGGAYVAAVAQKSTGLTPEYYFLDENGTIWQTKLHYHGVISLLINQENAYFDPPTKVLDTGIATSFLYQNLYYDGTWIYWSHTTGSETELIIINPSSGKLYHAGDFGEDVWPVGGLYVDGEIAPNSADAAPEPVEPMEQVELPEDFHLEPVITLEEMLTPEAKARIDAEVAMWEAARTAKNEPANKVTGILNATIGAGDAQDGTVTITLSEEDEVNNGVYVVNYDASKLTYVDCEPASAHYAVNAQEGTVKLACADLEPRTDLAELHFTYTGATLDTTVTVHTLERDAALALTDEELIPVQTGLADGFYLIGPDWTVGAIDPENVFAPNPSQSGEYLLETTLAAGDKIKVVRVENGGIEDWYPGGLGTEYTVDSAHAGSVTIYFRADYQYDWSAFGGFIWIAPQSAPLEDAQLACYLGVTADIELPIGISVLRNVLDGYDDWYVELTWTDDTGTEQSDVVAKDDPSISSGTYFYVVRSAKIPAKQCGDTFQVQAHAFRNGQEYVGPVKESSIKDLLVEQLKSTGVEDAPTYDPICARLCADILNYCASLQLDLDYKEDELCNEFPEDAKARTLLSTWATGAEPQVGNSTNTAEPNNRIFVNVSAQNRVVLGITVYGFSGNVEIHVTDGEGHDMGTVEAFQQGYGKVAYYRELPARGLRASYTYTVFEDGVDTGLYVEWSLERHVYGLISARDSGDPYVDLEQLQVFINLLKFIDSATAMFPGL